MERFSGLVENVGRFRHIAAFCVAATMAVVVLNIILRTLFNRPLLEQWRCQHIDRSDHRSGFGLLRLL